MGTLQKNYDEELTIGEAVRKKELIAATDDCVNKWIEIGDFMPGLGTFVTGWHCIFICVLYRQLVTGNRVRIKSFAVGDQGERGRKE